MTAIEETTHDQMMSSVLQTPVSPTRRLATKAGRFLWHLVQMIIVMEAGMMVYHGLLRPVLPTGFITLTKAYPLFGYWMMIVSMTLPMIALMLVYHKSSWGYSLGMAVAMLAPLAALTLLVVCSLFPIHTLYGIGDPIMILAMAAYLLLRPAHHAHGGNEQAHHEG